MANKDMQRRLIELRELMKQHKLDIYIIPSEDAHQSEFTAERDERRAYFSGFTGSAGIAIVTQTRAALATDGRYFNQAGKELSSDWELIKLGVSGLPTWRDWICKQIDHETCVGIDPTTISAVTARQLSKQLNESGGKDLIAVDSNLVDEIWHDRPALNAGTTNVLNITFAGQTFESKLADLRDHIAKHKKRGIVISALDEIAWLFNLRGNDIPWNPVFFAYAVVTQVECILFVDSDKLSPDARAQVREVTVRRYDSIFGVLESYLHSAGMTDESRFLVTNQASWALVRALGGKSNVEEVQSPVAVSKSVKNPTEIQGMRECQIRDSAALVRYFAWLENVLLFQDIDIDEVMAADKLEELRAAGKNFVGLSFPTISSSGPNAAVIHYQAKRSDCSVIDPSAVYLCDSGAQYLDGTTDTTRTIHFTTPTEAETKAYTLVLKGHIALDTIVFPDRVSGHMLDMVARQFLWREGMDYGHSTGHGVGSYLCVHETIPVGISPRQSYASQPLVAGNVLSNEPGYYEDGKFGIRIESVVIVHTVEPPNASPDLKFLGFEHVTFVPMCRRLTNRAMLTDDEVAWLDMYHAETWNKLSGLLQDDDLALEWLRRETRPFGKDDKRREHDAL